MSAEGAEEDGPASLSADRFRQLSEAKKKTNNSSKSQRFFSAYSDCMTEIKRSRDDSRVERQKGGGRERKREGGRA